MINVNDSVYTHFLEAREKKMVFYEDKYMKFEKAQKV